MAAPPALLLLLPCLSVVLAANKFGIGLYYPPGSATQTPLAANLVGPGGTALVLIPAGNITAATPLPPACPGFSSAGALELAYKANLSVVVRLEPVFSGNPADCFAVTPPLRDMADDATRLSYKRVAASYAAVAAALPMPPDGSPLRVQIANELNLAWHCSCDGQQECLSMDQAAGEAAAYLRDSLSALRRVPNLLIAASPMAPIGVSASKCCANASCSTAPYFGQDFLRGMVAAEPSLFDGVDWFSSHPYPCSDPGCGLSPEQPCTGWNAAFENATNWLTAYRNETAIAGNTSLPVIITETGWCMDCTTEALRAQWTVEAYKQLWLPDAQVEAVAPFLLDGPQWWPKGFPWVKDGTPLPVYDAVRQLRCEVMNQTCDGGVV